MENNPTSSINHHRDAFASGQTTKPRINAGIALNAFPKFILPTWQNQTPPPT
jgi:hypothetical protein